MKRTKEQPMSHAEAIAAVAQGVINIASSERERVKSPDLDRIEYGSRIYRGMEAICAEDEKLNEQLREIHRLLAGVKAGTLHMQAREMVADLLAARGVED